MAKTVVYDLLTLEGATVQVDAGTGSIMLLASYHMAPSLGGPAVGKQQDVSGLLTPEDRTFILALTGRLTAALQAQELM